MVVAATQARFPHLFITLNSTSRLSSPPIQQLHAMLMLPTTLRALSHHGARYLPRSMRLVGRFAVGTSPRHGPVRVDTRPQSQSTRRTSSSPTKHLFFVYAPDHVRPGMLDHR